MRIRRRLTPNVNPAKNFSTDHVVHSGNSHEKVDKLAQNLSEIVSRSDEFEECFLSGLWLESASSDATNGAGYSFRHTGQPSPAAKQQLSKGCESRLLTIIETYSGIRGLKEGDNLKLANQESLLGFVGELNRLLFRVAHENEDKSKVLNARIGLSLVEMILLLMIKANSDGGVDQRVLSGETLDNIVETLKSTSHGIIFPFLDPNFVKNIDGSNICTYKGKLVAKKNTKIRSRVRSRKRRPSEESTDDEKQPVEPGHDDGSDSSYSDIDDADQDQKCTSDYPAGIDNRIAGELTILACRCTLMLGQMVRKVPMLEDDLLLQVSSMCVSAFLIDGRKPPPIDSQIMQVQHANMDLLRSIFRTYREHRYFILDEIIEAIPMLPRSRLSRLYTVEDGISFVSSTIDGLVSTLETNLTIQIIVALILELLQCALTNVHGEKEGQVDDLPVSSIPGILSVQSLARSFLQKLLTKCSSNPDHGDDEDVKHYCAFLDSIVVDLLQLQHMPEWPAAELLLRFLAVFISNHLLKGPGFAQEKCKSKNETQRNKFSLYAVSILGTLLAGTRTGVEYHSEKRLILPSSQAKMRTRTICPICNQNTISDEKAVVDETFAAAKDSPHEGQDELGSIICEEGQFHTSCETCGTTFHNSCLRISERMRSFRCDDCLVLSQLDEGFTPYEYKPVSESIARGYSDHDISSFRQLLLNYLWSMASDGSTLACFAYEFHLSAWSALDNGQGVTNSTKGLESQWFNRPDRALNPSGSSQDISKVSFPAFLKDRRSRISRPTALTIAMQLAFINPSGVCSSQSGATMLKQLLYIMGIGQSSFRTKAIKSLGIVIAACPTLMKDPRVKEAVELRVMDDSISVREAALELVGKYVVSQPEIVSTYEKTLIQRLRDLGVSVRKRVIKIFRDFLLRQSENHDSTEIFAALAARIEDINEEETVREMITSIFAELWFCEPQKKLCAQTCKAKGLEDGICWTPAKATNSSALTSVSPACLPQAADTDTHRTREMHATSLYHIHMQSFHSTNSNSSTPHTPILSEKKKARQLTGLVPFDVFGSKKSDVDDDTKSKRPLQQMVNSNDYIGSIANDIVRLVGSTGRREWFATMLMKILGNKPVNSSSYEASEIDLTSVERIRQICSAIVEHLVNSLIGLQKEESQIAEKDENCSRNRDTLRKTSFEIVKTLAVFCDAESKLLRQHLDILLPYLKPKMLQVAPDEAEEAKCLLLRIFAQSLAHQRLHDKSFFDTLQDELQCMIYTEKPEAVIGSINCLGVLARMKNLGNDERIHCILGRFHAFLHSMEGKKTLVGESPNISSNAQRAVLGCGFLCLAAKKVPNEALRLSYSYIISRSRDKQHPFMRVNGLRALGMLLQRWPRLTIRSEVKDLLESTLNDEHYELVRAQALNTLFDLVEKSHYQEHDPTSSDEVGRTVVGIIEDQDSAASLITSLVQFHSKTAISRLFDLSSRVRIAAVQLVGAMLNQGIINPLTCIERMIALEADSDWLMHDTAHRLLVKIDERYPDFITMRAPQGIILGWEYSSSVLGQSESKAVVSIKGDHVPIWPLQQSFSVFSRFYRSFLAENCKQRSRFFNQVMSLLVVDLSNLAQINSKSPILTQTVGSSFRHNSLRALHYVAETIATLQFSVVEEPLFLIHCVNRFVSLHGEHVLAVLTKLCDSDKENESKAGLTLSKTISMDAFNNVYRSATQLFLLLKIKAFLKSTYGLSDSKCSNFNPNDRFGKSADRPLTCPQKLPNFDHMDAFIFDEEQEHDNLKNKMKMCKESMCLVMKAIRDDMSEASNDAGNEAIVEQEQATRKRKRKAN